jgi:hypothetical protein
LSPSSNRDETEWFRGTGMTRGYHRQDHEGLSPAHAAPGACSSGRSIGMPRSCRMLAQECQQNGGHLPRAKDELHIGRGELPFPTRFDSTTKHIMPFRLVWAGAVFGNQKRPCERVFSSRLGWQAAAACQPRREEGAVLVSPSGFQTALHRGKHGGGDSTALSSNVVKNSASIRHSFPTRARRGRARRGAMYDLRPTEPSSDERHITNEPHSPHQLPCNCGLNRRKISIVLGLALESGHCWQVGPPVLRYSRAAWNAKVACCLLQMH